MAFTEFYVQTTGSNLNAGSTTADAAAYSATNGGWNSGTGVFTPTSGNPSASVAVGDFASVYNDGATLAVFVGRVTAVDATTITVSTTAKTGTAPTTNATARSIKVGGAWQGPNAAVAFPFGFMTNTLTNAAVDAPRVNFKSGTTYSITAAMSHSGAGPAVYQGYTTSVGDGGKITIDGGVAGASYVLLTISGANNILMDMIFQNNGATGSANGVLLSGVESLGVRLVVHDIRGAGITVSAAGLLIEVEAYNCSTSNAAVGAIQAITAAGSMLIRCISHDNSGSFVHGFEATALCFFVNCIADSNGVYGYLVNTASGGVMTGCDAYNNGSSGVNFLVGSRNPLFIENCNFVKNGAWGIESSGILTLRNGLITNCGFGTGTQANASGDIAGMTGVIISGSVSYPANVTPWVDPANGDFRINRAEAKGAGRGSFTETAASYAGTVAYPDIGAAQHRELDKASFSS